jgi:dUTP pyrophosphatase
MNVKFKKLHPEAVAPTYAKPGDSGFDLVAVEDVIIEPGETVIVKTGLAFEIPPGYELQVRPRSGVSAKTKLRLSNAPGTIDSGYRGEVGIIVDNIALPSLYFNETYNTIGIEYQYGPLRLDGKRGDRTSREQEQEQTYIIRKGDRIAQGVIAPVIAATFSESDELSETERGSGGYGSTGFSKEATE